MTGVPGGLVDEVAAAADAIDYKTFFFGWKRLTGLAREMSAAELTGLVERLAPVLPSLWGPFAQLAVFAGACVEWGGSPVPLAEVLPGCTVRALRDTARYPHLHAERLGDEPLPDRSEVKDLPPADLDAMLRDAVRRGALPDTPLRTFLVYAYVESWLMPMTTCLMRREFRDAVRDREEVRAAADALREDLLKAHWVYELTWVLDDEPLLVLDRASRRGFRLTMSGIGDNFQLHTLVADRVTGSGRRGLLPGRRIRRAWVSAATDGPARLPLKARIVRRHRMFDGHGGYIYPEGRPSDIPLLDGTRVIVLHPPGTGHYAWQSGRTFLDMLPTLTLDAVLTPEEATHWLDRAAPARETDIMAPHPGGQL